jgi:ABC transport system ATP-binding/permease protein
MSETILNALVQLFALISDIHAETVITSRERDIVRSFLGRHLNNELVTRYMKMFEDYLDEFNAENIAKGSLRDRKRTSLNAMKILGICEKINNELKQKQKIYVLIQLIDFVSLGEEITENELDFIQTVADAFFVPSNEYMDIRSFIMGNTEEIRERSKLLIIDDGDRKEEPEAKHITDENMKGMMLFLHISSTNTYIMRYEGTADIYLNGQNVRTGETYIFDHGSTIRGAGINTIYYSEIISLISESHYESRIFLDACDVSFRFRNSDNGIHHLNFHEESGRLIGILGGSGAGKSTTLSILSGTLKPQNGEVLVNGFNLYDENDKKNLKGVIGFVPQDDLLIEDLTIYQNIYFNAKMCLNNLADDKIIEVVNKILADFDLVEVKDLKVGNPLQKIISGGQRKRVNIALELLREPTILFVDEPTSGLSSVDSEIVMNLLKEQTYKGKLVVINIHQPGSDIYKMFDRIMIIDKGGYQVFYGNPAEAIVYFKTMTNHANPDEDQCSKCGNINSDQVLQIIEAKVVDERGKATDIRKVTPAEWAERFREEYSGMLRKERKGNQPLPENNFSIPGLMKQSGIFFVRDLLSKLANKQYMLISLLGPPVLALLLAYFTKTSDTLKYVFRENDNVPAYLFMCVITSLFFGLIVSSEEIVKDRKILKRESFLNLSWLSYLNSKIIIMFLLSAVQTLSFILIGNLILEIKGMTLSFWLVLFTTSCFANMLGLNISSAFNSIITIYILIPFIIIPQLLFSGVLVKFDRLHTGSHEYVPVIGDMMTARWAFEAIAVKQFKDNRSEKPYFLYDMGKSQNEYYSTFLIDRLKEELGFCDKNKSNVQAAKNVSSGLKIIDYHINELSELSGIQSGSWKDSLSIDRFSTPVKDEALRFLASLKSHFNTLWKESSSGRDAVTRSLEKTIGNAEMVKFRDEYENNKLVEMILDRMNLEKTYMTSRKIIQKLDPGFMKPTSVYGRAHFYAPVKMIGNIEIDTYWFNILVIWVGSFILYAALYYKLPGKLISWLEDFRLQRSGKR